MNVQGLTLPHISQFTRPASAQDLELRVTDLHKYYNLVVRVLFLRSYYVIM